MAFLFSLLLFLIFAVCGGFAFTEGLWSNAIRLINVVTAALLAMNFFEPVAQLLDEQVNDSYTYFWDFLALWGLFVVFMLIFRLLTNSISRVKVRFMGIVDRIGGVAFAVLAAWVMLSFTMTTLHTAPLAEKFWNGAFDYETPMLLVGPDRQWVLFFTYVSQGSFSRGLADEELAQYGASPAEPLAVFDRQREFMRRYAQRRATVEKMADSGAFRTDGPAPKR